MSEDPWEMTMKEYEKIITEKDPWITEIIRIAEKRQRLKDIKEFLEDLNIEVCLRDTSTQLYQNIRKLIEKWEKELVEG